MPYIWSIPCPRNAHFTGRDAILDEIKQSFTSAQGGTVWLSGPGGVGKTQLAAEYAYRNANDYSIVWWVRADHPATLLSDLSELAQRVGVAAGAGALQEDLLSGELVRTLAARNDWLVVLDNVDEPDLLRPFLPAAAGGGHILVTCRDAEPVKHPGRHVLVPGLARADSVVFLKKRGGKSAGDDAVEEVAQALQDLPLALEQAASLARYGGLTYADYLRRFENLWAEYLRQGPKRNPSHADALAMTWELSFREVREKFPVSADLLTLCSLFAPDEIGFDFLRHGADCAPFPLADVLADAPALQKSVLILMRFALVKTTDRAVSLHRIVSGLARERLAFEQQVDWGRVGLAMSVRAFAFDPDEPQAWQSLAPVVPHVLTCLRHAEALGIERAVVANLYGLIGQYLHRRAARIQAREILEHALMLTRSVYGPDHPRVTGVENNLARVLTELGDTRLARSYYEQAITSDRARYGDSDPRVATLANNYGSALFHAGDADSARQQFDWALMVFRNTYGNEHSRVAAVMNNIGFVDNHQGDLAAARQKLEEAMGVAIASAKADHPMMACIRMNLGRVLMAQGDFGGARLHFEKALVIDEAIFGRDHPDTARDLVHLGNLELSAGNPTAALGHYRDALAVIHKLFGHAHTYAADCLNRLSHASRAAGDAAAAERYLAQCHQTLRSLRSRDPVPAPQPMLERPTELVAMQAMG